MRPDFLRVLHPPSCVRCWAPATRCSRELAARGAAWLLRHRTRASAGPSGTACPMRSGSGCALVFAVMRCFSSLPSSPPSSRAGGHGCWTPPRRDHGVDGISFTVHPEMPGSRPICNLRLRLKAGDPNPIGRLVVARHGPGPPRADVAEGDGCRGRAGAGGAVQASKGMASADGADGGAIGRRRRTSRRSTGY